MIQGEPDTQLLITTGLLLVRQRQEPDFIQGIGRIGDELPQEDVLVGVQRVDQDLHEPIYLRLEGEGFCIFPE